MGTKSSLGSSTCKQLWLGIIYGDLLHLGLARLWLVPRGARWACTLNYFPALQAPRWLFSWPWPKLALALRGAAEPGADVKWLCWKQPRASCVEAGSSLDQR